MFFKKLLGISTLTAVSMCVGVTVASGESSSAESQARYLPIQNISYEFGSKSMSGYFVEQAATCRVTLMITEQNDSEQWLLLSATRVRLILVPGQVAGLDSEEGHSLNFTCGQDAKTLLVDIGARDKLVQLQSRALPRYVGTPVTKMP
jgi:hypothetical protein